MAYKTRSVAAALITLALVLLIGSLSIAKPAFADYSIDKVDIDATVSDDGALEVVEQRTFDFEGAYHGIHWDIPKRDQQGRQVRVTVQSVAELVDGSPVALTESADGQDGTYQVGEGADSSNVRVTVYSAHENEQATFQITYEASNVATRHQDVGELYWKFVADGWDVASQNVTCANHLPVPAEASVTGGDNVRAWIHVPDTRDAKSTYAEDGVTYAVSRVDASESAEARVVFPEAWLPAAATVDQQALSTIVDEEENRADAKAADEGHASVAASVALSSAILVVAVGSIVVLVMMRISYRRRQTPAFTEKYYRGIPTDVHPAVVGALMSKTGAVPSTALTATLMRLTNLGAARLDTIQVNQPTRRGSSGGVANDYCLTMSKDNAFIQQIDAGDVAAASIDSAAADVVRSCAYEGADPSTVAVYFSLGKNRAKQQKSASAELYGRWSQAVSDACDWRFGDADRRLNEQRVMRIVGYGDFVALFVLSCVATLLGDSIFLPFVFNTLFACSDVILVTGIVLLWSAKRSVPLNREGVETKAKLEALKRWLEDYDKLGEPAPQNPAFLSRLLVLIPVLGTSGKKADWAEKVVSTIVPSVAAGSAFAGLMSWYACDASGGFPLVSLMDFTTTLNRVTNLQHYESNWQSDWDPGDYNTDSSSSSSSSYGGGGGGGAF